jgi:hypothetical protein
MPDGFPGELMWRQIFPPQMIQDLLNLSSIPIEQLTQLSDAISSKEVLAGESSLLELVNDHIVDSKQAKAALNALKSIRASHVQQILEVFAEWREASADHEAAFPEDAFNELRTKLPLIVRDYAAIAQVRKANWLSKVVGHELQDVNLICDVRPVFNESRDAIEMFIPLATLRLSYLRQNGSEGVFELVLDESQLDDISDAIEKARQKISVMSRFIEEAGE